jgi:hypothetical protein
MQKGFNPLIRPEVGLIDEKPQGRKSCEIVPLNKTINKINKCARG